jgi:hypothetical protein
MGALAELRRRRVLRVAAVYAVAAWGIEQLAAWLGPALALPGWILPFVFFVLVLGFPVAMILAWAFDVDRGGVARAAPGRRLGPRDKLAYLLLLGLGTGLLVWLLASHWTNVRPPFAPNPHSVEAWGSG